MARSNRKPVQLFLLLLAGIIAGSALFSVFSPILPRELTQGFRIGLQEPFVLDLNFIVLTFGVMLSINLGSIIGIIIAIIIYYKA